jgi:WD40 repeat protein
MTASHDRTVRIWDASSAKELDVLAGHAVMIRGADISPDSRHVATASWDWTARVWTIGGSASKPLLGHKSEIRMACFSPDDALVATACADRHVGLWNPQTSANISFLEGHEDVIWYVAFSANSKHQKASSGPVHPKFRSPDIALCQEI